MRCWIATDHEWCLGVGDEFPEFPEFREGSDASPTRTPENGAEVELQVDPVPRGRRSQDMIHVTCPSHRSREDVDPGIFDGLSVDPFGSTPHDDECSALSFGPECPRQDGRVSCVDLHRVDHIDITV